MRYFSFVAFSQSKNELVLNQPGMDVFGIRAHKALVTLHIVNDSILRWKSANFA